MLVLRLFLFLDLLGPFLCGLCYRSQSGKPLLLTLLRFAVSDSLCLGLRLTFSHRIEFEFGRLICVIQRASLKSSEQRRPCAFRSKAHSLECGRCQVVGAFVYLCVVLERIPLLSILSLLREPLLLLCSA